MNWHGSRQAEHGVLLPYVDSFHRLGTLSGGGAECPSISQEGELQYWRVVSKKRGEETENTIRRTTAPLGTYLRSRYRIAEFGGFQKTVR